MKREDVIGKTIKMEIDGKSIVGKVLEWDDLFLTVENALDHSKIWIPVHRLGPFRELNELKKMHIFSCKDERGVCKGMRALSVDDTMSVWPCKESKTFSCEIRCVGCFDELPMDLRIACLDRMHSPIPVVATKKSEV